MNHGTTLPKKVKIVALADAFEDRGEAFLLSEPKFPLEAEREAHEENLRDVVAAALRVEHVEPLEEAVARRVRLLSPVAGEQTADDGVVALDEVSVDIAPGTRSPSSKITVGVPVMRFSRP